MAAGRILLVDDDHLILESMADWLRGQGFEVHEASDCRSALECIAVHPLDLVVCDIRLPDGDGFDILTHVTDTHPQVAVVLMTGYATVETSIEAMRAGAFDLLTKPLIDAELLVTIKRALSQRQVVAENKQLKQELESRFGMENIIGQDHRMRQVYDVIHSVADTRATVLITGESGTGKSMIARAIHRASDRRDRPFVEVACGALPDNLLESELFGHVAGAFTGAVANKDGKFLQADGGTIFLDEIGTASQSMQVKLLRVLQELEFEALGGTKTHRVDTRVVLATNEDLEKSVAEGSFRQDLFYRINVINVEVPALRRRREDVALLAQHFLDTVATETGRPMRGFSAEALEALKNYHWPGNVRELQNVVERAVLLGKHDEVVWDDLPAHVVSGARPLMTVAPQANRPSGPSGNASTVIGKTLKEALEGPEREIIREVLEANNWNRNETADQLGINRTTLYKKMKRLGLDHPSRA